MKLLIVTQAVDTDDSVLGFFVRWIEEFAKHAECVEVICLREGKHALPANVRVHSLGKEKGRPFFGSIAYGLRFLALSWRLRRDYDTVFVHMNPEYFIVAGWLWRFLGKRTALWYTHKSVNIKLRIAVFFSHMVFTASKESFRLKSSKVRIMGHGIDTDFFTPPANGVRGDWALSVGRLMKSKRHDLAIRQAMEEGRELRIAGDGPERGHLERLAKELGAKVTFLGPLSQKNLRDEYRHAAYLIHTSETGSLDKVILEAAACGLPVRTNNPLLAYLESANPASVRERHSLSALIPHIMDAYVHPRA